MSEINFSREARKEQILYALRDGPRTVSYLASQLGVTRTYVYPFLKELKKEGKIVQTSPSPSEWALRGTANEYVPTEKRGGNTGKKRVKPKLNPPKSLEVAELADQIEQAVGFSGNRDGDTPKELKELAEKIRFFDNREGTHRALYLYMTAHLWDETRGVKLRSKDKLNTLLLRLEAAKVAAEKIIHDYS